MNNHRDKALIVFARSPHAGIHKTKLSPPLTPEQASALYEAIMLDGIDLYRSVHGATILLYCEKQDDRNYFAERFPDLTIYAQDGETFGDRMSNAFDEVFSLGYRRVMLFGTDLPTFPLRNIFSGYQLLDAFEDAVVIGPIDDGGIYTIGLRSSMPELFHGIHYGKNDAYDQTMKRLCKLETAVYVLPPWYDIVTMHDVRRLDADLSNPEFGHHKVLLRTTEYMQFLHENNILPPHPRKKSV